ncbi:ORM1-like protein 2 [Paramacrobiotus metropolitanus]|uniref:ORM1-like protein 2 n=1 Tax=Paramacrobiotus metropolitanus TaxID=2943436 RepID=UPI002445E8BD|nr:ORM1-like protein 2 [Paramacrobiotus metropolitanus]
MFAEGAPSHNPNVDWLNTRGMWTIYCLILLMFHLFLLSIPIDALSVPVVWTLTNVLHNLFSLVLFHFTKGTPWLDSDQGRSRALTFWEQIDDGIQYTTTKKFFTILPIVLYLMTGFYTNYDQTHFIINTISLLSVLIPKLPYFHRLRLFGINRY